jgi:hypothetical protein
MVEGEGGTGAGRDMKGNGFEGSSVEGETETEAEEMRDLAEEKVGAVQRRMTPREIEMRRSYGGK